MERWGEIEEVEQEARYEVDDNHNIVRPASEIVSNRSPRVLIGEVPTLTKASQRIPPIHPVNQPNMCPRYANIETTFYKGD